MLSTYCLIICTIFVNLVRRNNAVDKPETDSLKDSLHVPIDIYTDESQAILKNIDKQALRYGFERTKECQNFGKAFICVRKCLDLNYDTAYSNRTCHCTCFRVHDLQAHKIPTGPPKDTYKKGYPSTIKPYWVQGILNPDTDPPADTTTSDDDDDGSGDDSDGSGDDHDHDHNGGGSGGGKGGGGASSPSGGGGGNATSPSGGGGGGNSTEAGGGGKPTTHAGGGAPTTAKAG